MILTRFGLGRICSNYSIKTLVNQKPFVRKESVSVAASTFITKRSVGYWLLGNSALVFGVVVVGGLTRLTESGLSMVDWTLLGRKPPTNNQEWDEYFEKYKQYPEYQILNSSMNVNEFKRIYWFEYTHRMLGRLVGVYFLLPAVYFASRGFTSRGTNIVMGILGSLILGQGLLGWYMVQSGLDHKIVEENLVPRVSQYRLASHLSMAFAIYLLSLSASLAILKPSLGNMEAFQKMSSTLKQSFVSFRNTAHGVAGLTLVTAISGAFVAGLDAGLIYNTFPKMANAWIPTDIISPYLPFSRNFFENPSAVQFNHRWLAITTYTSIILMAVWSRRFQFPRKVVNSIYLVVGVATAQVCLGISTLLWLVPVSLASMHQCGSLILLSSLTYLLSLLKRIII